MGVMPDRWIREMSERYGLIEPCAEGERRKGKISFGISAYGYDFRLSNAYKIPDCRRMGILDPKRITGSSFEDREVSVLTLPPNSFVLGRSLEYFRIPRDILALCFGKSTYARCGLVVNVTPFEPEWEGFVTISLINSAPVPIKIYSGEGIAQVVFLRAESECRTSYRDKDGKYQAQRTIQVARV